jgi:hypothetical protein
LLLFFVQRNGIPSSFLFRGRVRKGFPGFSVLRNSRNSIGNNPLFRLFRLSRNYFFVGNSQPYFLLVLVSLNLVRRFVFVLLSCFCLSHSRSSVLFFVSLSCFLLVILSRASNLSLSLYCSPVSLILVRPSCSLSYYSAFFCF